MAGIDLCGVRKDQKLGPDRVYQLIVRSTGEIGPPYTVSKQCVASDDKAFCGDIKTRTTRCVPRCMQYLYPVIAQRNHHAIFQKAVRLG